MAGRIFIARVDAPPEQGDSGLRLPAAPRHAPLAGMAAGDFLLLLAADGPARGFTAQCDAAAPPVREAGAWIVAGRVRLFAPMKILPLAVAHRFLHDGVRGPADLPGADDGKKIDAALRDSRCVLDPKLRGTVPKIVQFWRWLESGEGGVG